MDVKFNSWRQNSPYGRNNEINTCHSFHLLSTDINGIFLISAMDIPRLYTKPLNSLTPEILMKSKHMICKHIIVIDVLSIVEIAVV